jgi:hypothetical protein
MKLMLKLWHLGKSISLTAMILTFCASPAVTNAAPAITVDLSADTTYQWIGKQVILTATASQDIVYTPYFLSIYDYTHKMYLKICTMGSTCSTDDMIHTPVPYSPISNTYQAFVGSYPPQHAPPSTIIASDILNVTWHGGNVRLSSDKTTLPIGGVALLTATTTSPIEQGGLWTMIFDATTATRIAACSSGTKCLATVHQSAAATHKYIAYTGLLSPAMPPMILTSTSAPTFITWADTGWSVGLSYRYVADHQAEITATANKNVMASPYYISIFNVTTNQRIAMCLLGTTCTTTYPYTDGTNIVAFVSGFPYPENVCPPQSVQANSKTYTLN